MANRITAAAALADHRPRIISLVEASHAHVIEREARWDRALDAALVGASPDLLARLHDSRALVVTTGQQPALLGGPLYTVHKAIAAAALARALSRRWARPVVPLFWAAGDDHDHAEASRAAWLGGDGRLVRASLQPRDPSAPQLPMSRQVVGDSVGSVFDRLAGTLPGTDLSAVRAAWRPDATIHAAFLATVAPMLARLGVALLDPTTDAVKRAQAPLLGRALDGAAELDAAIAAAGDAGTGITAGDGATLVFLETDAGRERLVRDGDGFMARRSGTRYERDELAELLQAAPERFSANVLLRPVVEAALLPTVAYVAGPGEYRYLTAQAARVYPLLGVIPQSPVARWAGALLPAFGERLLQRLAIDIGQVTGDDGALGRELLRRDRPEDVTRALGVLRKAVDDATPLMDRGAPAVDPVLQRAAEGRLRRVGQLVDDLEAVIDRHLRRRQDIAWAQFERLRGVLMPGGEPQERVLSVAPMHATWGDAWPDAAVEAADAWASASLEATRGDR